MVTRAPIPNIDIGQVYDLRYADADVHYEKLGLLADFFGRNMPVHRHDRFFQLHYVKSGSVRVSLDDQLYHQQGPLFFLTPPTVPHAFVTENDSDGHVLTVRQQMLWPLLTPQQGLAQGPAVHAVFVALSELDVAAARDVSYLDSLFELLSEEFRLDKPGRDVALASLVRLIFVILLRFSARSSEAKPMRRDDMRFFHRFNQLIELHYMEHRPLASFADQIGITEARLNGICRRIAGLPSKRLLQERLMQEARRLLLFSDQSVSEICYSLGFKDPAYFHRFFVRNAGVTPGLYRHSKAAELAAE
ncbi:4-hydroxyphenylacetate catabolism regulatory protein HpaA [Pseudomonas sp. Irchel s3f7]|jgi:AraC family 4-hydroxyphenylacetate 3-monooxygenase operon regulatory protein|uniref:4-hydroxyphenylacetate catabolism regulatory protein HpaA n=1 Tax=Pseudomonas sp. Irchel s3f7 TaxID=2009153 RepID=UPI000BA2E51E|nr:4-hydroxyphenylacetate catabolism regulatory protein HpaA [Pseudomonas sp. Irchel s3f7]